MNVFVLSTGRCGSTTFAAACDHIRNYTSSHESRTDQVGEERIQYPSDHIEVDNRLSWFLGRLDERYGDDAFYVHLKRNQDAVASSFERRYGGGIIRAYSDDILMGLPEDHDPRRVCLDYCRTVNSNIESFLKDKTHKMNFDLETAEQDFEVFWDRIQAEGELRIALDEWNVRYNKSGGSTEPVKRPFLLRVGKKLKRIVRGLPEYVVDA